MSISVNIAPGTVIDDAPEYKSYRDFNTTSFEGRVSHLEVVTHGDNTWVAVSVATTLEDGTDGVSLGFTNSNSILMLARAGHLSVGRRVHVTGSLKSVASHYMKDGKAVAFKKPRLQLTDVTLRLGAKPNHK